MRLEDWCHQAMFHMWESLGFGSTYAVAMWKKCQVINQLSLHNFGRPQNHLLPPWMTTQTTPSCTNRRIDKHSFMNKNPATKNIYLTKTSPLHPHPLFTKNHPFVVLRGVSYSFWHLILQILLSVAPFFGLPRRPSSCTNPLISRWLNASSQDLPEVLWGWVVGGLVSPKFS